jgi:hypothetical protein
LFGDPPDRLPDIGRQYQFDMGKRPQQALIEAQQAFVVFHQQFAIEQVGNEIGEIGPVGRFGLAETVQ